jgi:bifunctional non-homologous end joining protein LigD
LPSFIEPSLALLVEKPPTGPQWVHEIKFDGYRIQTRIDGKDVRVLTRKALGWTSVFQPLRRHSGHSTPAKALPDGKIVSEDEKGVPHFSNLQADLKSGRRDRLRYHVFDLPYLDGYDLTGARCLIGSRCWSASLGARPLALRCPTATTAARTGRRCSSTRAGWGSKASSRSARICRTGQDAASTG